MMMDVEQYRLTLPKMSEDALREERMFALGQEWQDRYEAIKQEMHRRGFIDDNELAYDPFDPATIGEEDRAFMAAISDEDLVREYGQLPLIGDEADDEENASMAKLFADEIERRGLDV